MRDQSKRRLQLISRQEPAGVGVALARASALQTGRSADTLRLIKAAAIGTLADVSR